MTKDVLVSLRGLQFGNEYGNVPIEVIAPGEYYNRNGKHYVLYDEVSEGEDEPTHNILKITDTSLDVTRKGLANVHMVFEENKKNISLYRTPFGEMQIGILAKSIDCQETDTDIDVNVEYSLEVNYEFLAECTISVKIKSKESKDFSLLS